jgi:biotin synthase-related radical SAM superfamily protein
MAAEQISELITLAKAESKPADIVENDPQPTQKLEPPISPLSQAGEPEVNDDRVAASILSAPPEENDLPVGTINVLKTRKQLITKIQEVCAHRGTDAKALNLARRRKNSLQEILKDQFAEAAEQAVPKHHVHDDLQGILPEGMEDRKSVV